MKSNVLFAHDRDVKKMHIGWRFYHLSKEPPHKYKGGIILEKNMLKLRSGNKEWSIPYEKIKDLYSGFDRIFKRRMSIFRPLRITYQTNKRKATIYLFVDFHKDMYLSIPVWTIPKTKNEAWLDALKRKITNLQR